LEVLAHEFAHYLDYHSSMAGRFRKLVRSKKAFLPELRGVSYNVNAPLVEGFAEFVRLWMTQYDTLPSRAPKFLAAFEKMLGEDPKLNRAMRDIRRDMHVWYRQGPEASMASKIGEEPRNAAEQVMDYLGSNPLQVARQRLIDRFHAAKVVERTVKGSIGDAQLSAAKLFQLTNGWEGVFESVVRDGTIGLDANGDIEVTGPGLVEVLEPVARLGRAKFDKFLQYMAARRAQELMEQGREKLFTNAEIEAGLNLAEENPVFSRTFDEWLAFNERMIRFYVQTDLITPDMAAAFSEANRNYVPFHRVVEVLEDGGKVRGPSGRFFKLTGGGQNVRDLGVNIVESLAVNVRAAMVARAKSLMYRNIMSSDDGALFAARLAPDSHKVRVAVKEMADKVIATMRALGISISSGGMVFGDPNADTIVDVKDVEKIIEASDFLTTVWQHNQVPSTAGTYVDSAIVSGQRRYFEVKDPLLVDMLTKLHQPRFTGAGGKFIAVSRWVKRFMTRTVTLGVQFVTANAWKDTASASLLSRSGFRPVLDTLIGMGHFALNTEVFKDFRRHGGAYAGRIENWTAEKRSRARLTLPPESVWDRLAIALAAWDRFGSAFEYASRVGEFRRAVMGGASKTEAAFRGREISTDFGQRGNDALVSTFASTVPFMNAALQGLDRTAREIAELDGKMTLLNVARFNRRKAIFVAKGLVLSAATIALWALNRGEDWYDDLTDDERARFWWVKLEGMDEPIKIPRPFDLGHIFGTAPEALMEWVARRDGDRAARMLAFAAAQSLLFTDMPGILQPIIEAKMNRDWRGVPIVPYHLEKVLPRYQYRTSTPELYRQIGRQLNVSPLLAQHYVRSWLGYFAKYAEDATEAAFWRRDEWGERPFVESPLVSWPAHQFIAHKVPYRTRWTEKYYELRDRAQGVANTYRKLRGEMLRNREDFMEFVQEPEYQMLRKIDASMRRIDVILANARKAETSIRYDKNLTAAEKEARIEEIYRSRNRLLKEQVKLAERLIRDAESSLNSGEAR
ncbi:MAG: hypothetical protein D6773_10820, partial [Alphaproteobacteria bacterium]